MSERIQEQIRFFSAIEPEAHFFEVGRKMFCADMVPSAHHPALKERESVFDSVRVNVSNDIDFFGVIDCLVFGRWHACPFDCGWIGRVIIGKDHVHVFADILADVLGHCLGLDVFGMKQSKFSVALPNPNDDLLVFRASALVASPTDVGFIHLNFPIEHRLVRFDHRGPDAMAEIPCSLIADSNGSLNLTSRHTFFGFAEEQGNHEPFRQRQMRVIENRSSRDRELIVAILAVEQFLIGLQFDGTLLAARAFDTKRPAQTAEHFAASFVSRELSSYVH